MSKRWMSMGEILTEPDGSNLHPVAAYPVIELQSVCDESGRGLHRIVFERMVRGEELYYNQFGERYLRSIERPVAETIVTDNSVTSRWLLIDGRVLIERRPVGDSVIDRMANGDEHLLEVDSRNYERQVAVTEALGLVCRSIIEDFRPIVDSSGNFIVNPFPLSVGKTN